ncbi:MAG: hypothetical protein ACJ72D_15520, partial [Marmoricola sp.]
MRHFSAYGLHGTDIRGVRPYQVIGLVWFANFVGAIVLFIDYLVVLPFPAKYSTHDIVAPNIVLGLVLMVLSWLVLGVVGA